MVWQENMKEEQSKRYLQKVRMNSGLTLSPSPQFFLDLAYLLYSLSQKYYIIFHKPSLFLKHGGGKKRQESEVRRDQIICKSSRT